MMEEEECSEWGNCDDYELYGSCKHRALEDAEPIEPLDSDRFPVEAMNEHDYRL